MKLNNYEVTVRENLMVTLTVEAQNKDEAEAIVQNAGYYNDEIFDKIKGWLDDSTNGFEVSDVREIKRDDTYELDIPYEKSFEIRKGILLDEMMDAFWRNKLNGTLLPMSARKKLEKVIDEIYEEISVDNK